MTTSERSSGGKDSADSLHEGFLEVPNNQIAHYDLLKGFHSGLFFGLYTARYTPGAVSAV